MQVGAIGVQTYVYNTNRVNSASMNSVSAISDDLTTGQTDYSGLASEEENINPLRKGESVNFIDIINMQMQIGQNNANRIMKPADVGIDVENAMRIGEESVEGSMPDLGVEDMPEDFTSGNQNNEDIQFPEEFHTPYESDVSDVTKGVNIISMVQGTSEGAAPAGDNSQPQADIQSNDMFSRYQMRHAAEAYAFGMAM